MAVTASAGCPWTAASGVSWITITSGSGGTGNGTVNYSVAANATSTARIGTMTIAGLTFTVTQSGTSCGYSVSPVSASASASAGTGTVSVATSGTCSWNAASNAGWIIITSGNGGASNGSVNYSVQANTGTNPRTGTLTAFNRALLDDPSAINTDGYGAGWLFEMEARPDGLLGAAEYHQFLADNWEKTQRMIKGKINTED